MISKNFLRYFRYTKNKYWSKFLIENGVQIPDFSYNKTSKKIYIRSVDAHFAVGEFPLFFKGYKKYCLKFIEFQFSFQFINKEMFLHKENLVFKIETLEELFIINEVFIENTYKINSQKEYVVFDIGMNVGIASLFFSQFNNIKKIYGFEPFEKTFKALSINLALNPVNNTKIEAFNYGLSNENKFMHCQFDNENRGNVGIKNNDFITLTSVIEKVKFKNAAEVLEPYIKENYDMNKILKLDCEGSEYDILESLLSKNLVSEFDICIIEWHKMDNFKKRLFNIIEVLKKNNFIVLTIGSFQQEAGMIYCIKQV